jgi:hypothetical protein
MSTESHPSACRVIGGEKLPAESGGSDALCNAIAAAAAEQAPGLGYSVEVTVHPLSRLSASVTTEDGRKLEGLNFTRMDRPLSQSAFKHFASSIAAELAKAGGKKS